MWNTIKSYGKLIAVSIVGIFAFIFAFNKIFSKKPITKTQKKIDDNTKKIEQVKVKEAAVKTQKHQAKTELAQLKQDLKTTNATKTQKRKPGRPKKTTSQAKQNIVSKTKRNK